MSNNAVHFMPQANEFSSLAEILKRRAVLTPDAVAYVFLDGDDKQQLTYRELDTEARAIAAMLQTQPCKGERVLLMYPQGLPFVSAFFGCLYAGSVAVLMYPPTNLRMAQRMDRIISDCGVKRGLTDGATADRLAALCANAAARNQAGLATALLALSWIHTDRSLLVQPDSFVNQAVANEDLAFLQYTSGSTGNPKGVMVSHGSLLANQEAIRVLFKHDQDCVMVSWLPVLHDMGLVGSTLQPMYCGFPLVFMSPLSFIQRPVRWLRAISEYGGTTAGGPNFAFDLCTRKVREEDKQGLDLSSWRVAFNGSEPVRANTMQEFYEAFSGCGFRRQSLTAVYGLAEATLIVSGTEPDTDFPVDPETGYVCSGVTAPDHEMFVVDPATGVRLADGQSGEIWFRGPSNASGYWARPEETAATFDAQVEGLGGSFMRTGDMGYMRGQEVFVTGRIKDLIIVRGRNYHAEDLEWSLEGATGVKHGHVAAFLKDEADGDSLTLVAGVDREPAGGWNATCEELARKVFEDHQLEVREVHLIKFVHLPKTTSGKTQRRATREKLLRGEFALVHSWTQTVAASGPARATSGKNKSTAKPVPAANDAERELAQLWADVLGLPIEEVGVESNFFSLGGMSVLMLELARRLDVSLELVFKYPTIRSFLTQSGEYAFPDVEPDLWLPPKALDAVQPEPTNLSLITGGNGLFGFHFLVSMLKYTQDRFVLVIRGKDDAQVLSKFRATAQYYGCLEQIDFSRIQLLRGDFAEPRLGLSQIDYDTVCRDVQRIYHIGSHVNNWLPYEGIKEINVEGTRNLLTVARTGRQKEFHYASTSTFSPRKADDAVFLEGDDIEPTTLNKYNGYDISKYVSETLTKLARAEGTPASIYRMVWVGGRADTGLSRVNDGFNIMLRILITLKVFPEGNYLHDIVPVDLMADAMASVQGKSENLDFHLTSQSNESVDMQRIVAMLRNMGYELQEVSRERFVEALRSYPDQLWDEHCRSYRQLVIRLFDEEVKPESFYDSTNLRTHVDSAALAKMQEKFVDDWFRRAVLFLIGQEALPTPTGKSYQEDLAQIEQWNAINASPAAAHEPLVHELVSAQGQSEPEKVALIHGSVVLSYAELDARGSRIANHLRKRGAGAGDLIGVCLDRSFDLYATQLGILKAGCAFVPLDPSYPTEVLAYILRDSAARFTFTSANTTERIEALGAAVIRLAHTEQDALRISQESDQLDLPRPQGSDLAYVIYTSGTTGKPKGVMVEHHNLANLARAAVDYLGLTAADNVLQFAPMNFDSFIEEVYPILSVGGSVTLIGQDDRTDVQRLRKIVAESGVTLLKFPTAFWHRIADVSFEGLGVRAVAIGGEEADLSRYRAWLSANPNIPIINTYGPTEITVTCTVAQLSAAAADKGELPIGQPIRNTGAHVLDESMRPVPVGVMGELYISGEGVSRGYLNRTQETQGAFLDAVSGLPSRVYRTGDLARWTESGELVFHGRKDNQVKVRGFRVELGSIEATLHDHPDVASAAVVVRELAGERRLIAYLVSRSDAAFVGGLREYLRQKLPSYMIPDGFVELDAMPITAGGKIDRVDLEHRELTLESVHQDYVPPQTELEHALVDIWKEVLGLRKLGIDDDFLELGGHSLLAISLLQQIERKLGHKLGVQDLYSHLTVRSLADYLEAPQVASEPSSIVSLTRDRKGAFGRSTLFLVHGVGGNLASFYPLARNLEAQLAPRGVSLAIRGLQANPVDGRFYRSASEMVGAYVQHIRSVQPHGPYWLGAWSYGVSIASLIANELTRQGEVVERFLSIDAESPRSHDDFSAFLSARSITRAEELYEDENLDAALHLFGYKFGFTHRLGGETKTRLARFLGYPSGLSYAQRDRYNLVAVANLFNSRDFAPDALQARQALLIKARASHFEQYCEGWDDLLPRTAVEYLDIDADHWSIMNSSITARAISEFLFPLVQPHLGSFSMASGANGAALDLGDDAPHELPFDGGE